MKRLSSAVDTKPFLWRFCRRSTGFTRMVSFICLHGTEKGPRMTRRRSFSQNTASSKKLPRYMNWCVQLFRSFFFCFFMFSFPLVVISRFLFRFVLLLGNGAHDGIRLSFRNGLISPRSVHIGGFQSRDKTAVFVHKTIANDGSCFA